MRRIVLIEPFSFDNLIEEFPAVTVLRHEIYLVLVFEDLIKPENVWMCQVLQDIYLILEADLILLGDVIFL